MRRDAVADERGVRHTSEKKRKEMTCAEGCSVRIERGLAHVREEKEGNDVCGGMQSPMKEECGTYQKRKKQEVLKKNRKKDEIYNTTVGNPESLPYRVTKKRK